MVIKVLIHLVADLAVVVVIQRTRNGYFTQILAIDAFSYTSRFNEAPNLVEFLSLLQLTSHQFCGFSLVVSLARISADDSIEVVLVDVKPF